MLPILEWLEIKLSKYNGVNLEGRDELQSIAIDHEVVVNRVNEVTLKKELRVSHATCWLA